MTLTETRPETVEADVEPVAAPPVGSIVLTTGDHKRLGLLFIYGGALAVLAGMIAAAILAAGGDTPNIFSQDGSRLASAATAGALVIGVPALWIGLATYLVPLQLGATRLGLPRLHTLALWTYAVGGVLVAVAYAADRPGIPSLAASVPPAAEQGQRANEVTELLIVGLAVIALATLLAAVSLAVTVLARRADGLRLAHVPLFSWSVLGTASVLVLSTPVFLAGLVLLYFDQHYGGSVFAGGEAALRIWSHELWIAGRPEALLFAAGSLGIFCDAVATATRRPLAGHTVARGAVVAAPAATLLVWIGGRDVLASPFAPLATVLAVLIGAPVALALLTWLGSVRAGVRFMPALLPLVVFLLLVGLAVTLTVVGLFVDVEGPDAEAFRNGQLALVALGAPLAGVVAGLVHWSPKLWGRVVPTGAGGLHALFVLGGAVLLAAPGYGIGLGGDEGLAVIASVGAALLALAAVAVLAAVARRGGEAPADPYEGLTLEWVAASPPPAFNFDRLPEIRSAYPLHDSRATTTGASA